MEGRREKGEREREKTLKRGQLQKESSVAYSKNKKEPSGFGEDEETH
jgi:hypothetical protein